jgi:hypothetical protein
VTTLVLIKGRANRVGSPEERHHKDAGEPTYRVSETLKLSIPDEGLDVNRLERYLAREIAW